MTYPTHKNYNYNCKITTESGDEFLIYANWLNNNDLNHFRGWKCYTGTNRIYVSVDQDVFNGLCNTVRLGNLNSGWDLVGEPITCPNDTCTSNTDDLITKRYSPETDGCGTIE